MIAVAAEAFMRFLDANVGYGADWPISIVANGDVADELIDHMNTMREVCGIEKVSHDALYIRPPLPEN